MDILIDMWPLALRDTLIAFGVISIIAGVLIRRAGGNSQGLGASIAVIGVMMVLLAPLGVFMGWW